MVLLYSQSLPLPLGELFSPYFTMWLELHRETVQRTCNLVFLLLGANRDAGFTDFLYSVSGIFVAPFTGMFGEPTYGTALFEISSILAIVIYLLIAWGIVKLFTITRPKDEI